MNSGVGRLIEINSKQKRIVVGLMSGTSFDGLDIAVCRFEGAGLTTKLELLHFATAPFDAAFKEQLKLVFAKEQVNLRRLTLLNAFTGKYFARLVLKYLSDWGLQPKDIDILASHGQTIFHAPRLHHGLENEPNATLQIGDGDHLSVDTGIITVSDFRQKHVAAGGEGAPLAVYGDYILFSDFTEDRIMLNIGGIANFTFLPADGDAKRVFSTDAGPGNTLMDQYIQKHYPGKYYDKDASIALAGKVDHVLLNALLSHPFFNEDFPKTTGPELFNLEYLEKACSLSGTGTLKHEDVLATLCNFSANGIINSIKRCFTVKDKPVVLYERRRGT